MHAPRHRFHREETMARSHQRGTVRPEHKSWVGYMNAKVLDPITGEPKWKKQRVGVLGSKAKMTKNQAREALDQPCFELRQALNQIGRNGDLPFAATSRLDALHGNSPRKPTWTRIITFERG